MKRGTTLSLCLALTFGVRALAQTHPNLERGFSAGKAYQTGDVDSVNLFNGNLSISIPLGQAYSAGGGMSYSFALRYNSNVWEHKLQTFTNDCTPPYKSITVTQTTPHTLDSGLNGGLGWSLDFGTLLSSGWGASFDEWTYVSPDGSSHRFYNSLHDGETERSGFRYTRDGSYIRLVASLYSSGYSCLGGFLAATLEFPDGRQRNFSRSDTCHPFVLVSEADRFGNSVTYTLDVANSRWVIQDSTGRAHYVGLKGIAPTYTVIDYVDLAAFDDPAIPGSQRARYTFAYQTAEIARSCKHYYDPAWDTCDPMLPPTVSVPLLTAITQPDGSQWTIMSGSNPGYNLDGLSACSAGTIPKDRPGTITRLQNPLGGRYDWTWGTWANPEGGTSCYSQPGERGIVRDATGVYDRTLTDPFGASTTGIWKYRHDSWRLPDGSVDSAAQESWTTIESPTGDQSKHYFRTQYCGAPTEGWDYGLPYSKGRDGNAAEPWISSEQYDGATSPANLRRTSYLRYAKDVLNSTWRPSFLQQSNRRVDSERTVFNDDPVAGGGYHYTTANHADFDGLGHYRITERAGSFGSVRRTATAYNLGLTYPPQGSPPQDWWPLYSPWLINAYAWSTVSENGATAKTEACFDSQSGYLERSRSYKLIGAGDNDPVASSGDVVVRRTQSAGNTIREEWFGGDQQAVGTGSLCSLALPASAYRIDHTYVYGSLASSRYYDGSGTPASFFSVDRDIDSSTGLVSTSRDSAGLATRYSYDSLGRLTWTMPATTPVAGDGWVQNCYNLPVLSLNRPAWAGTFTWANGTSQPCGTSATPLTSELINVDGFGRVFREVTKTFDGNWTQRSTAFDGLGQKTSRSEWQQLPISLLKKTEYLEIDPFGRPGRVRPPDGAGHDVSYSYTGVRVTSRTESIATAPAIETPSTRTEERDHHGRLFKVSEPSGPGGTPVTTTYSYDVGARLSQASTTSGSTTQVRQFAYDGRGFLASEKLPEVGPSGNGFINYSKFDARGHALRVQDGSHDLALSFDSAERLVQVSQSDASGNPGTPLLKSFSFGASNSASNWKNGKLEIATAYNPELAGGSVVETYSYGGRGGRASARLTQVEGRSISQSFTWTDLGRIDSLGYPDDSQLGTAADPTRTLGHSYSQGFLTGVSPYVAAIGYHPNGTIYRVFHSNGTRDVYSKDPDDLPRMSRWELQRSSDGQVYGYWGPYAYDGAGNVKSINMESYTYDLVSRLTLGTAVGASTRQCAAFNAFGALSALGTGTTTCTPSPIAVVEATNRLASPAAYDSAGNLTSWAGYGYTWNRLNQMVGTTGSGINRHYLYTADGERVAERNLLDGTGSIWVRDLGGKVLREYGKSSAGQWSWAKDYVYRDGLLATTLSPAETRHIHLDHLGSIRCATNELTPPTLIAGSYRDYYPFGMEAYAATDPERMRFTGHQRDTFGTSVQTDDVDYMHARFYSPIVGRFLSIDPGRAWNARDPQSWNQYAYARNNPLKYTDPDGRLFQLAGCASGNGPVCGQEQRALQASVGRGAAKYLVFGKGGGVTLNGISAKAFGAKFGTVAGGLGRLIANKAATFTLDLGNPKMANTTDVGLSSGGARFQSSTGTIFADPSKFPLSKGGVAIDTTEAVVHEMGHALATLYQGLSADIDAATNPRRSLLSNGEGYATSFENHYRREILGVGDSGIRAFYGSYGDYVDPGQIPLFPQ